MPGNSRYEPRNGSSHGWRGFSEPNYVPAACSVASDRDDLALAVYGDPQIRLPDRSESALDEISVIDRDQDHLEPGLGRLGRRSEQQQCEKEKRCRFFHDHQLCE